METPQNRIKIVEVTQVSPSLSAADHQEPNYQSTSLNLTCFDLHWLKFHPVERLFFYEFTGNSYTEILHRLKYSLSLALSCYLPLASRITWGPRDTKPYILCSPTDSVSVVVAESSADKFNKLSSKDNIVNAVELRSYAPSLQITDEAATVISILITFFPSYGFCIGIAAHHGILDGKSTTMFMKSWAHLCRNFDQENEKPLLLPAHLTPCFDRTVINDPTGKLDMLYLNRWLELTAKITPEVNPQSLKMLEMGGPVGEDHVRATFDLTREHITKIREKIISKINSNDDLHLSSFVITYAYTIVCIVKATALDQTDVKVNFAFMADFRSRLVPPVPANYFSNCVGGDKLMTVEAKDVVGEDGLEIVAKCISDSIKNLGKYAFFERAEEVLNSFSNAKPSPFFIGVAGSPKLEVYGVDFGWGRPKKVDVVSIDEGTSFSMAESGDQSGGIEIGLVMKTKVELQAFASLFVNGVK